MGYGDFGEQANVSARAGLHQILEASTATLRLNELRLEVFRVERLVMLMSEGLSTQDEV